VRRKRHSPGQIRCSGTPGQNGYIESSDWNLRDELLDLYVCTSVCEAKALAEGRRRGYKDVRPHSSPRRRPPAPEGLLPAPSCAPA